MDIVDLERFDIIYLIDGHGSHYARGGGGVRLPTNEFFCGIGDFGRSTGHISLAISHCVRNDEIDRLAALIPDYSENTPAEHVLYARRWDVVHDSDRAAYPPDTRRWLTLESNAYVDHYRGRNDEIGSLMVERDIKILKINDEKGYDEVPQANRTQLRWRHAQLTASDRDIDVYQIFPYHAFRATRPGRSHAKRYFQSREHT